MAILWLIVKLFGLVWIDHLRRGNARLATMLQDDDVCCHQFVAGEMACGNLKNRDELLGLLDALPQAPVAEHIEVLELVAKRKLAGRGLAWIDLHLLASALIGRRQIWTMDKALNQTADELEIASQ